MRPEREESKKKEDRYNNHRRPEPEIRSKYDDSITSKHERDPYGPMSRERLNEQNRSRTDTTGTKRRG